MALTELQKLGGGRLRLRFEAGEEGEEVVYIASPLTLTDLAVFEDMIGPLELLGEANSPVRMQGLQCLLWRTLRHRHTELTLEQAGDLITLGDLDRLEEILEHFLPSPKVDAAGEAAEAGQSGQ